MNTVPKKASNLQIGEVIVFLMGEEECEMIAVATLPTIIHDPYEGPQNGKVAVTVTSIHGLAAAMFFDSDEVVQVQPPEVTERATAIRGMRELLDFLEAHPEVPAGNWSVAYFPQNHLPPEQDAVAEVDRVAKVLGVTPTHNRHYKAAKRFGPATEYEVIVCDVPEPDAPEETGETAEAEAGAGA